MTKTCVFVVAIRLLMSKSVHRFVAPVASLLPKECDELCAEFIGRGFYNRCCDDARIVFRIRRTVFVYLPKLLSTRGQLEDSV